MSDGEKKDPWLPDRWKVYELINPDAIDWSSLDTAKQSLENQKSQLEEREKELWKYLPIDLNLVRMRMLKEISIPSLDDFSITDRDMTFADSTVWSYPDIMEDWTPKERKFDLNINFVESVTPPTISDIVGAFGSVINVWIDIIFELLPDDVKDLAFILFNSAGVLPQGVYQYVVAKAMATLYGTDWYLLWRLRVKLPKVYKHGSFYASAILLGFQAVEPSYFEGIEGVIDIEKFDREIREKKAQGLSIGDIFQEAYEKAKSGQLDTEFAKLVSDYTNYIISQYGFPDDEYKYDRAMIRICGMLASVITAMHYDHKAVWEFLRSGGQRSTEILDKIRKLFSDIMYIFGASFNAYWNQVIDFHYLGDLLVHIPFISKATHDELVSRYPEIQDVINAIMENTPTTTEERELFSAYQTLTLATYDILEDIGGMLPPNVDIMPLGYSDVMERIDELLPPNIDVIPLGYWDVLDEPIVTG